MLHRERDLWLPGLLTQPIPLAACLSLAGTRPIFEKTSLPLPAFPPPLVLRTALACDSDFVRYPLSSWLADLVKTGPRHHPWCSRSPVPASIPRCGR